MADTLLAGRYALGAILGTGGFANVHAATDVRLSRAVAVKVLRPELASHEEASLRLEREGRIGRALVHPNLCAVSDVGRDEGGAPFLVMERLEGESLATRIARAGALPIAVALDVAVQLLDGLACAHAAGVVHRDVTPANVFLVDPNGARPTAKLLDFGAGIAPGLANPITPGLTRTGEVVGTPAFLSPEQARGEREIDARSDVYSAAVVIHEAITGARPFGALAGAALLEAIAHRKPPSLASTSANAIDPRVVRAVDLALNVSAAHRPSSAGHFRDILLGRSIEGSWDLPTAQGVTPPRRA